MRIALGPNHCGTADDWVLTDTRRHPADAWLNTPGFG